MDVQNHANTHKNGLNTLCRLCGNKTSSYKGKYKPKSCLGIQKEVLMSLGINFDEDIPTYHATEVCQRCYSAFNKYKNYNRPISKQLSDIIKETNQKWKTHSENQDNCWVCQEYLTNSNPIGLKRKAIDNNTSTNSSFDLGENDHLSGRFLCSTPKKQCTSITTSVAAQVTPSRGRETTIKNIIESRTVNDPLSVWEEKLLTSLVRRKLKHGSNDSELICKTGGKPLVFMKVERPQILSNNAKSPLKKQRTRKMKKIREKLSGGINDSMVHQLSNELKGEYRRKRNREMLSSLTKLKLKKISAKQALTMKAAARLTWGQTKVIMRHLKSANVNIESYNNQCDAKKKLLRKINIRAKLKLLTHRDLTAPSSRKGIIYKKLPMAYITNLPSHILEHINKMDQYNMLIDNSPIIPKDQVWIKIGGDKGGSSTKVSFQVLNTSHPNSTTNTLVFAMVRASDSRENLETLLNRYKPELEHLKTMKYKEKSIKLFLCGDYEFLTKTMGLSGPAGSFPCLWCNISHSAMKTPRKQRTGMDISERNLKEMEKLHTEFLVEGDGKKANAKNYKNVIHPPLFDIELSNICPPYLHILLGLVLKHHNLLIAACNKIDKLIGRCIAREDMDCESGRDTVYGVYIKGWKKIYQLKRKWKKCINTKQKQKLYDQMTDIREKLNLKLDSGPVAASLDGILKKHNIHRAAYHGKSFVGNHCHKCLTRDVYEDLGNEIVRVSLKMCQNLSIKTKILELANEAKQKFIQINQAFAQVHLLVSHGKPIENNEIPFIQSSIDNYLSTFRTLYPDVQISPKQHILEDHIVPLIVQYKCGMGLHGEQGIESIHKVFNALDRRMCSVKNPVNRLTSTLTEYYLACQPEIISANPIVKREVRSAPKKL